MKATTHCLARPLLAAALAFASPLVAAASADDSQCLACHSTKGFEVKLANKETLSLHVDGKAFGDSVHGMLGCNVCHAGITLPAHPPAKPTVASVRDNSVAMTKVCRGCHGEVAKRYEGSTHAALLRDGNPVAPICTTCHDPHAMKKNAAFDEASGAPCSTCHSSIFEAYGASVHGKARKQGRVEAPSCGNCHGAHEVRAAAAEQQVRDACYGCHAGTLAAHKEWLPNAALHMRTVSCASCHSPGAKRRVDLRLYESPDGARITQKEGVPEFEALAKAADTEGKGLNALALRSLLHEFGRDGVEKAVLRGRLEVASGEEFHQIGDKSRAVARCETCHSAGAAPFQSVTVSIAGPGGRPVRYDAKNEVLDSAASVEAVRGFYVIGGTRIKLLDLLVLMALLGGIATPIGHLAAGWLFRKYAKRIGGREDS